MSRISPQPASAEGRLAELGIKLPPAPNPLGAYVESVQTGNLLYLSGILPVIGHEPRFIGRLGKEFNVEQGREAARLATLNALSAARNHLGSLDKVGRVAKLTTYIATESDFIAHAKVADASSELLREVFGEHKLPVRMVLGVASLPLGVPVVVELVFEVSPERRTPRLHLRACTTANMEASFSGLSQGQFRIRDLINNSFLPLTIAPERMALCGQIAFCHFAQKRPPRSPDSNPQTD